MQSLFRSVGHPANFCCRRSLFSTFSSAYSARAGSSLLLEARASERRPTPSLSPLLANSWRACSSIAHMSSPVSHPEYRLPPNVKPTHYDLIIRTDLENQAFDGSVNVKCAVDMI